MANPQVQVNAAPTPSFRILFASEDVGVHDNAPVKRWVDEFAKRLRVQFDNAEKVSITPVNLGAAGGETADAPGTATSSAGLLNQRARADDYVVVFTPDLALRPRHELKRLVDDLQSQLADADLRPALWLVKLDKSTFRNLDIGKAPVWHELRGRAANGARFHRTSEAGWDDEMADTAVDIAAHRSCGLALYCCPRHAAANPAPPAIGPAPSGGGIFSRLGSLFRRGAG